MSICLFAVTWALPLAAEPFIPTADAQILERLPSTLAADSETRLLRAELAADPDNLELALSLARRYIEAGRAEADPRYQGYAQAVLAPWWDLPQPPSGVLLLRATIRQKHHDFDGALDDLNRLLRREPRHAQAWLIRAVVLLVKGDVAAAADSCRPLRRTQPLLATACFAGAVSLGGRAAEGYAMLSRVLERTPVVPAEDRLWALTTLAEIAARRGEDEAAERHFEEALALGIRDVYLLGAYADFLLDTGRPQVARDLVAGESRADALLLRLALAEARLGLQTSEGPMKSLAARFAENRLRGEGLHLGAESRFRLHLLGQPAAALRLARENWAVQREPADARRLLEAAVATGDRQAARPVLDHMAASGLEDVRLADLARRLEAVQ